jgi:hypothetical protein
MRAWVAIRERRMRNSALVTTLMPPAFGRNL